MNMPKGVPIGTEITIPAIDDYHLHLRDNNEMWDVIGHSTRWARRAVIMPNRPLIRTVDEARNLRGQILAAVPKEDERFEPLMTLCLTDDTPPFEITRAKQCGFIVALKAYAADAKNDPATGITSFEKIRPALKTAEMTGMPVSIHGEATVPGIDIFEREQQFVRWTLPWIIAEFPCLRVSLEHLSTAYAVRFIEQQRKNVFATIAPHYLLANRNDMLAGGISPDFYCSPILQSADDQWALLRAATSGDPHFGLGTDSAPWGTRAKYAARGKGGCFNAPVAPELYAEAFDSIGKIKMLGKGFAGGFGADFYGLPRNTGTITLVKEPWQVPESYPFGDDVVAPFRAGEMVQWKIKARN
ncbi:MAG: dihydroorotase [Minisyncoccota bacterium]